MNHNQGHEQFIMSNVAQLTLDGNKKKQAISQ
jgi:hypothetical protein